MSMQQIPVTMLMMLAWRNLWRNRRRTLITLSSIALGFGMAVLSIGIGDGSHNSLIRNAIQLGEGHLTIQHRDYLDAPANHRYIADGITLAAQLQKLQIPAQIQPRVSLQVLATTAGHATGAGVEGVALNDPRAKQLQERMVAGRWMQPDEQRGLWIGERMAHKLGAKIGSKIVLMAGTEGGDSQAQLGRVRGIFRAGMEEMDRYLILTPLHFAQRFLQGEGAALERSPITRYALFFDHPDQAVIWKQQLQQQPFAAEVAVLEWQQLMPQLLQFIAVDDAGNYIFLTLILILVIFGIINTVLMSVLERTREFGLLRALGMGRAALLLLVFYESLLLSLMAVVSGWLVGGGIPLWLGSHGIDFSALGVSMEMMGTMMDPVIYTELSLDRIIQLTLMIFGATLASGVYPAIKAARVTPIEALQS